MKLHSSVRLRRRLPAVVVGTFVLLLAGSALWRDWQEMRDNDNEACELLKNRLSDEGLQLEYLLRRHDESFLAEQLSQFGAIPEVLSIALVDERGQVLNSSRSLDVGRAMTDALPGFEWSRFFLAQQTRRLLLDFTDERRCLLAYKPITLAVLPGQIHSPRIGGLLVKYDLATGKALSRKRVVFSTLIEIGFALALMLGLMLLLRRWISEPLRQLEEVLSRISRGEFITEIEISGRGELAKLGRAIVQMQANLLAASEARDRHVAALRESEGRFRVLFEQAAIGVAQIDSTSGRFIRINKHYCELVGYTEREMCGLNFQTITYPEDLQDDLDNMQLLLDGELREFVMEKRLIAKDGRVVWVLLSVSAMWEPGAETDFHIAVVQDITHRKRVDLALRESEAKLRKTIDGLGPNVFVGLLTTDGRLLEANLPALTAAGLTLEEVRGMRVEETYWFEHSVAVQRQLREAITKAAQGVATRHDMLVQVAENTRIWIDFSMTPLLDETGKVTFLVPSGLVIHERKQAEEAVRRSERFLKTIIETEPECVKLMGGKGELLEMNAAGLAMLEVSSLSEVVARGLSDFILPQYRERFRSLHQSVMAGGSGLLEFEIVGLRGTHRWLETHAAPIRDESGRATMFLGITRDVTARKETEAALRESLEYKEALLKEVHHRVKNNLQVIASLLRLEAARSLEPDTKFVLRDMKGRIQAMALLHELLYRSGTFASVDLATYIKQITTHIFRAVGGKTGAVHLGLDLASIPIKMDQAMPCGLLVHELVSNCLKHAFLDGRPGEIHIELQRIENGSQVRLRIRDNGVGLPTDFGVMQGNSLGLQLVSDLTRQLDGTLSVERENGAVFIVTFTVEGLEPEATA